MLVVNSCLSIVARVGVTWSELSHFDVHESAKRRRQSAVPVVCTQSSEVLLGSVGLIWG